MPREPKFVVSDLFIDEGALVEDGDNPKAHITLFKMNREEPAMPTPGAKYEWRPSSTSEVLAARRFSASFYEVRSAYVESVYAILNCVTPGDMGSLLERTTTEFVREVRTLLDAVKEFPGLVKHLEGLVEQTKSAATTGDGEAINQALEAFDALTKQETTMPAPTNAPTSIDAILASLPEPARAAMKAHLDEQARAATESATKAKEAADKAAAEAVQAQVKAAQDAAKAAQDEVAKLKDAALTVEFNAKAREIGSGDVGEVATLLKSAYGRSPEEGAMLEKTLRAMAAQARHGMKPGLKVVGNDNPQGQPSTGNARDDATAALEVKAAELMKANPKLTEQSAFDEAATKNHDLAKVAFSSVIPSAG